MKILTAPQSGSQAGTTASRNRFGQYLRTRAIPVQPRTPKQTSTRSFFTNGSSGWRGITAVQREAWNNFAAQISRSNSLGSSYAPTGASLFTGCAVMFQGSIVADAPTTLPIYVMDVSNIQYTDPTPGPEAFDVTINNTSADNILLIETSGPVSPGITSAAAVRRWRSLPQDTFNLRANQFSMASGTVAILANYNFLYPSPVSGETIWFRFREIWKEAGGQALVTNRTIQTFKFTAP